MRVLIVGQVIGRGKGTTRSGDDIYWLKLYQSNGEEAARPGETADIWTREPLACRVGEHVEILASVRADGDRLRVQGAELVGS